MSTIILLYSEKHSQTNFREVKNPQSFLKKLLRISRFEISRDILSRLEEVFKKYGTHFK